jgi:hypothetical protein
VRVALWTIANGEPRRLEQRRDFLEVDLEDWIERHPELTVDGMDWVGRQIVLPDRSRLDLVGVTREGQLVIAELKRGTVDVGTLTQAIHYVLTIAAWGADAFLRRLSLSEDTRELLAGRDPESDLDIAILLIGTARAPELDRAAEFLTDRGLSIPVRTVTFAPFVDLSGQVLLAREEDEHEQESEDITPRQRSSRAAKIEWIQQRAREFGVGDVVEEVLRAADELGLNVKPWPKSLTVVPPFTRGRTLLYVGPNGQGQLHIGYNSENLATLYGASERDVQDRLGENWTDLNRESARRRIAAFAELMRELQEAQVGEDLSPQVEVRPIP